MLSAIDCCPCSYDVKDSAGAGAGADAGAVAASPEGTPSCSAADLRRFTGRSIAVVALFVNLCKEKM